MLLALLYCESDRIAAAALACDQMAYGDNYWSEVFQGNIESGSIFETAYVELKDRNLISQLLELGIESDVDGKELAQRLETSQGRKPAPGRAA